MNQIKVVLVDDEPDNIKTLELLIARYCADVSIVATFIDPKAAIKSLPKLDYDLLLLDIEMPGMTGFEMLKKLTKAPPGIIFITAHSSYAVRAFKFNAMDYLLKPVDVEDLVAALDKCRKNKSALDPHTIRQLVDHVEALSRPRLNKLAIPTQDGVELLTVSDIVFLKADRNYTLIKRLDKKDIIVAKTLGDFEEMLAVPGFMRINKQYLINLDKVARYVRSSGNVVMCEGTEMLLSRTRKDEFLQFLSA